MKTQRRYYPIEKMAKILDISKGSYYFWIKKINQPINEKKDNLVKRIKEIFKNSYETYGYPRVTKELKNNGEIHNKKKVARIMRENNLRGGKKASYKPQTTVVDASAKFSENLLNQNFKVDSPNKVWVSDITYIHTKEGFLYLCMIIDLYSRKVIGWSIDNHMETSLLITAFNQAVNNRKDISGLIFHSDRGSQYTSNSFRKILKLKGIIQSMSRKGNCWDNACAESFFSSLKNERIYRLDIFENQSIAKSIIFEYIEIFYNKKRLHSYLDYKSPEKFELQKIA